MTAKIFKQEPPRKTNAGSVPKSVWLPEDMAFLLEKLSAKLGISQSKIVEWRLANLTSKTTLEDLVSGAKKATRD